MYNLFYCLMLGGYLGVSLQSPSLKMKIIGLLLCLVNGLIFLK